MTESEEVHEKILQEAFKVTGIKNKYRGEEFLRLRRAHSIRALHAATQSLLEIQLDLIPLNLEDLYTLSRILKLTQDATDIRIGEEMERERNR